MFNASEVNDCQPSAHTGYQPNDTSGEDPFYSAGHFISNSVTVTVRTGLSSSHSDDLHPNYQWHSLRDQTDEYQQPRNDTHTTVDNMYQDEIYDTSCCSEDNFGALMTFDSGSMNRWQNGYPIDNEWALNKLPNKTGSNEETNHKKDIALEMNPIAENPSLTNTTSFEGRYFLNETDPKLPPFNVVLPAVPSGNLLTKIDRPHPHQECKPGSQNPYDISTHTSGLSSFGSCLPVETPFQNVFFDEVNPAQHQNQSRGYFQQYNAVDELLNNKQSDEKPMLSEMSTESSDASSHNNRRQTFNMTASDLSSDSMLLGASNSDSNLSTEANIFTEEAKSSKKNYTPFEVDIDYMLSCGITVAGYKPRRLIRKRKKNSFSTDKKDIVYWEKREKNNSSARRSRETKKDKERRFYQRALELEFENQYLRERVHFLEQKQIPTGNL